MAEIEGCQIRSKIIDFQTDKRMKWKKHSIPEQLPFQLYSFKTG